MFRVEYVVTHDDNDRREYQAVVVDPDRAVVGLAHKHKVQPGQVRIVESWRLDADGRIADPDESEESSG